MPCRLCGQSLKNHLDTCPVAKKGRVDSRPLTVVKNVPSAVVEQTIADMTKDGYFVQERRGDGDHVVLKFMLSA